MVKCDTCAHQMVAFDHRAVPAPGVYGLWVVGCVKRKIRFGSFAQIAAGEKELMPVSCENYEREKN